MRPLMLVFAAALCALVAAGCGGGSGENAATAPSAPTENEAAPVREQAPEIEGTSLAGEPISLADHRGRAVLINVWSSW